MAVPVSGQPLAGFTDTTLRQRIHVSIGGNVVRLRLTNVYGKAPLVVASATLARPGAAPGDIDVASLVPVTFAGSTTVTVPTGAEFVSDPVHISVSSDNDLLASLYLPGPTGPATFHRDAFTTGFVATGDQTAQPTVESFPGRTTTFWFLDGLDVQTRGGGAVAFLGDSITDGTRSTADANHRWPDYLADRMLAGPRSRQFGIANAGISGNRLLLDYTGSGQGVNALARLERDVLTQTGVQTVFVFEGINDIQNNPTQYDPEQLVRAYQQIIQRAHDGGLRVIGSTLGPWEGWSSWTPEREAVRVAVNKWIRTAGAFDAVVDFDKVLRDPAQPQRMLAAYDSGDHLHPGDAGYQAMAAAVDLRSLR
jgi:lysophospholipase L1-like esterase